MAKKDAGQEFAEIWGEAIHSARHLRILTVLLGVLCLLLIFTVFRLSGAEPPRPIVVRVDEVGRAEAVAYEVAQAQADPLDPTTKYFLLRFLHDFYGRQTATVEEYWARSLRFLTPDLATAAFRRASENVAMVAAGRTSEELRVDRVVLRIQAQPQPPHGATADFELVRTDRFHKEIGRERWSVTMQFVFMAVIPTELMPYNPMGLVVTYLQADRAMEVGSR